MVGLIVQIVLVHPVDSGSLALGAFTDDSSSTPFQAGLPDAGIVLTSPVAAALQDGQSVEGAARQLCKRWGLEPARLTWRGEVLLRLSYKRRNYLVHVVSSPLPAGG